MLVKIIKPDFEFNDTRGSLVQLFRDNWKQVNIIRSFAGNIRGGHYHKENIEGFYLIEGKLKLILIYENEKEEHIFSCGDMFVIEENITHYFEFMEDTLLVSMYSNGVELSNGDKDIYSYEK